jgi:hypothetical protein
MDRGVRVPMICSDRGVLQKDEVENGDASDQLPRICSGKVLTDMILQRPCSSVVSG